MPENLTYFYLLVIGNAAINSSSNLTGAAAPFSYPENLSQKLKGLEKIKYRDAPKRIGIVFGGVVSW